MAKATKKRGWDNLKKRCPCRDQATCKHAFLFRLEHNGREIAGPLWKLAGVPRHQRLSLDEAKALRDRIRAAVFDGTFQEAVGRPEPSPAALTFVDVAARYVADRRADVARRPHRNDRLEKELAVVARTVLATGEAFGTLVFEEIRRHHIDAFRDARRALYRRAEEAREARRVAEAAGKRVKKDLSTERPGRARGETGINRYLQMLRAFFNWALRKGYRDAETPFKFKGVPDIRLAKERARTRRLSVEEERRLWLAAGPHLRDCITAALDTGMRRGEILGLQWRDVRWENDEPYEIVLRADATKTGTSRTIPLLPTMAALLKARRLDPNGDPLPPTAHVFGNAVGEAVDGIKVAWGGTCKRAGIEGLTFHDLRRSAASRYLEAGLPLNHVKELLGHQNITTTSRYLSVTSTELRASMVRADAHRASGRRSAG